MGKNIISKTSSKSQKISKNHDNNKKQQMNSLIKFLKPKVYITDSSNFKCLVQQLTGNGNSNSNGNENHLVHLPPPPIPQAFEAPVMPIIIDNDVETEQTYNENWIFDELSFDSSEGSGHGQSQTSFGSTMESSMLPCIEEPFVGTMDTFSQFKNLESWLLDTDLDYHYEDVYVPVVQQDLQNVSVFDGFYDTSCFLSDDSSLFQY